MTPDQYCQDKAAQSGSSFYYSFLFLPPEKRRAITALYAFCREVDDVVDECSDTDLARTKLAWWRNEVSALFSMKSLTAWKWTLFKSVMQTLVNCSYIAIGLRVSSG
jgi:phytoene/squalene synthetase